jgi:hypothetical protein
MPSSPSSESIPPPGRSTAKLDTSRRRSPLPQRPQTALTGALIDRTKMETGAPQALHANSYTGTRE